MSSAVATARRCLTGGGLRLRRSETIAADGGIGFRRKKEEEWRVMRSLKRRCRSLRPDIRQPSFWFIFFLFFPLFFPFLYMFVVTVGSLVVDLDVEGDIAEWREGGLCRKNYSGIIHKDTRY